MVKVCSPSGEKYTTGHCFVLQNRNSATFTARKLTDKRALTVCPCTGLPLSPQTGQVWAARGGRWKLCAGSSQTAFPASGGQQQESVIEKLTFLNRDLSCIAVNPESIAKKQTKTLCRQYRGKILRSEEHTSELQSR